MLMTGRIKGHGFRPMRPGYWGPSLWNPAPFEARAISSSQEACGSRTNPLPITDRFRDGHDGVKEAADQFVGHAFRWTSVWPAIVATSGKRTTTSACCDKPKSTDSFLAFVSHLGATTPHIGMRLASFKIQKNLRESMELSMPPRIKRKLGRRRARQACVGQAPPAASVDNVPPTPPGWSGEESQD